MKTELLGWLSSIVLLVTIGKQIHKQWHDGTSKGVSKWLFIGQLAASMGFSTYSYLVHNWVFVVTNALMGAGAVVGLALVIRHRANSKNATTPSAGRHAFAIGDIFHRMFDS